MVAYRLTVQPSVQALHDALQPPRIDKVSRPRPRVSAVAGCSCDHFAAHANHLDTVTCVKLAPDRVCRQVSLTLHEAGCRISELGRCAHHGGCIVARAIFGLRCNVDCANEYQCRKHFDPQYLHNKGESLRRIDWFQKCALLSRDTLAYINRSLSSDQREGAPSTS